MAKQSNECKKLPEKKTARQSKHVTVKDLSDNLFKFLADVFSAKFKINTKSHEKLRKTFSSVLAPFSTLSLLLLLSLSLSLVSSQIMVPHSCLTLAFTYYKHVSWTVMFKIHPP